MKILHIITQKPHSTGSGVYMSELIDSFIDLGHSNSAKYGIDNSEETFYDEKVIKNYEVRFNTEELPFNVFGMSDEMPYHSSQFKNMDEDIFNKYKTAFTNRIEKAVNEFKPDLIICHHLYLLTAITRELVKNIKIFGICHNTDIRQFIKTHKNNDYIKENIQKLDVIFSPTDYIKQEIIDIYNYPSEKIKLLGTGYNDKIFVNNHLKKDETKTKFIYVGKVARAKGVLDLVKAFKVAEEDPNFDINNVELTIAGKSGNDEEYNTIVNILNSLKIKTTLHGMLDKKTLSSIYNEQDVFIIPSYTEAVPLTSIEALSCGLKVVITDIPGIKDFLNEHIKDAYIDYIDLPKITNVDETTEEEARKFEIRIKNAILKAIANKEHYNPIITNVSFSQLANNILKEY